MYYCYSIKDNILEDEITYAKSINKCILFDEEKNSFFDSNGNEIDITGLKIFPRSGVLQSKKLIEAIEKHGDKVESWPNYIETNRNTVIMLGSDITLNNQDYIFDKFGTDRLFLKTKIKNFSGIIDIMELLIPESNYSITIDAHKNEEFILSECVNVLEDEYGRIEYRTFVVEGEILNISRSNDYLLGTIPNQIIDFIQNIVDKLKTTDFPSSYVIDSFIYKKNDEIIMDVLECNPIISSGTYLYNSVFEDTYDLNHTCPSASIPNDKKFVEGYEKYSFNSINKQERSICYDVQGGFASDLRCVSLLGKSGIGMYIHFENNNLDNERIARLNLLDFEPINSDSDFRSFSSNENNKQKIL